MLKYLRVNDISYSVFASKAGVSKSQLGEVVMDRCRFGAVKLRKVVRATKGAVTVDDLLFRTITPRKRR